MGNTVEKKISDLMLWNDSNLEFVLEPEVYAYLKKVRKFITEYNQFTFLKTGDSSCLLWMMPIFPEKKRPSFRDICNFLQDSYLYDDFQSCCNMIHGQDIRGILDPFLFYESICFRFYIMMRYIFATVKLTELNNELIVQIQTLEDELITLIRKYAKITI